MTSMRNKIVWKFSAAKIDSRLFFFFATKQRKRSPNVQPSLKSSVFVYVCVRLQLQDESNQADKSKGRLPNMQKMIF